jgi:3-hydroxybutyryl-CoA dehydratase
MRLAVAARHFAEEQAQVRRATTFRRARDHDRSDASSDSPRQTGSEAERRRPHAHHRSGARTEGSIERLVTCEGIAAFDHCSGGSDPLHPDEAFASPTRFGGSIAHRLLSATYLSGNARAQLPGAGAVSPGQTLRFKAPVHPVDAVFTAVTVKEIVRDTLRVVLATSCRVGETEALEAEAVLLAAA